MRSRFISRLVVFSIGILLLGTVLSWSQATTAGSVAGQVTDQSGAVIPGADVALVDTATATELRTTSNAAGRYVIVNVASGHYILKVTHDGFTSETVSNIEVQIGASVVVNAQLKVGSTKETVTVEAQTITELQTTNATIGNTVDSKSIQLLPNLGREVQTLAVLQPGTTPSGYTAGANYDQNTYRLDGGNITDDMGGQTISYQTNNAGLGGSQSGATIATGVLPTPLESVEEMKVSVAGSGIDFNNSAGANVQMVTKRGTNQFHGSLYEYYFDTAAGAANSWANDHTCVTPGTNSLLPTPTGAATNCPITGGAVNPIVSNHRNRFGFAVGGPVLKKKVWGGSTYFFYNMEFLRFPNVAAYEKAVPTPLLKAGVIQLPNAAGVYQPYNLNTTSVTVGGVSYAPIGMGCGTAATATAPAAPSLCDPRSLGPSPLITSIWNKYQPTANDYTGASGDTYNTAGFLSAIRAPQRSTYLVGRLDHDFGDKNRFFASYRYYNFSSITTNQVDIGGGLPGDTLGTPVATAPRPQKPSFLIFGLTSNLTSNITNDLRVAYTRTYWQYFDASPLTNPLIPGEGGGPEIGGESTAALIPYNINTQSTRTRFWDGQDKQLNDSISHLHGNHLFQYGFSYQRDNDYHSRNDNGSTIDVNPTYLIQSPGSGSFPTAANIPIGLPSAQNSTWETYYSELLGFVAQSQVTYTRTGAALNIQPLGTQAFDRSIIPYYNWYWGDTWHVKPSLTVVYGLAYAIEMPPYELNGKQINLVDASGNEISASNYLQSKQAAALQGQNYNPQIGYELVGNIGSGLKYPYNPFYGGFSPRLAMAWNPSFGDGILGKVLGQGKTVIRGGYSRIYGRLNGVDQVLVPLLGPGFLQGVACANVQSNGTCPAGTPTPANIFRFGPDGIVAPLAAATPTLPQPYFPGATCPACPGGSYPNAGDVNTLDPNFKPSRSDQLTFSIQRQISRKVTVDVGYIGRISKNDFQEINLDAIPTMYTLGGQTFANAYGALYTSVCTLNTPTCAGNAINTASGLVTASNAATVGTVAAQPFFENALGGATSAYCKGFANCTTAVASNLLSSVKSNNVAAIWQSLNSQTSWVPGKTTIDEGTAGGLGQALSTNLSTALGFSNYNALYISGRMADWHGMTLQSNFTWGRALGTAGLAQLNSSNTALNPWNMQANYGPQSYDIPIIFNLIGYYQPPFFKNQKGPVGWLLGGWTIAPLFTAQSGSPIDVGAGGNSFGETAAPTSGDTSTADGNAVAISKYSGGNSRIISPPTTGVYTYPSGVTQVVGGTNLTAMGQWANPASIYSQFRPCVLGVDTNCGGYTGQIRAVPVWNLDATIAKNFSILKEDRLGATLIFQITNIMNHMQPGGPSDSITAPTTFGRINSQANTPRNMEFGLRLHF